MNSNSKKTSSKSFFKNLFEGVNLEENIEHEAHMLSFRFLSEIERIYASVDEKAMRKTLAKKVDTSPSYLTQLFRGDKLVNLPLLAKFQEALNIKFEINAIPCGSAYEQILGDSEKAIIETEKVRMWISSRLPEGYSESKYDGTLFETVAESEDRYVSA